MKHVFYAATTAALLCVLLVTQGCAHNKHFGDGEYQDASYDNPEHFDDRFNEFDSKFLIDGALKSFEKCGVSRSYVYMVSQFDNQTSEMLDVQALQRELIDQLNTNGFTIIDKAVRPELHSEYQYNDAGYVNPAKAPFKGKQEAVQLILRVALTSKSQNTEDDKTTRYRLSIQASDTESALVKCTGSHEIKKKFTRTRVAL